MRTIVANVGVESGKDLKTVVEQSEEELVALVHTASAQLSYRIRKDTTIVLHAQGTHNSPRSVTKMFGYRSAIANRLLLYMLYRAGAFMVRFTSLESVKREFAVSSAGVVQRHGTSAKEAVLHLFADPATVEASVDKMRAHNDQSTDHLFPLGSFSRPPRRRNGMSVAFSRTSHPEPIPGATQLAALPFLAAVDGYLCRETAPEALRLTLHRVMSRNGRGYLQQVVPYLGTLAYSPVSAGRVLPMTSGIIGRAYKDHQVIRRLRQRARVFK